MRENSDGLNGEGEYMALCHRMFEFRKANLRLFDMELIVSFSEALVAKNCPVIHNNSFVTRTGGQFGWHQDDSPHYLVTEGTAPTNIRLPVLLFTGNYYLTDVTDPKCAGTEVIPGSHLSGSKISRCGRVQSARDSDDDAKSDRNEAYFGFRSLLFFPTL